MAYNLTTGLNNISSIVDLPTWFSWVNNATEGYFGIMTLISLTIIIYIVANRHGTQDAFILAAFSGFLISLLLFAIGLVNGTIVLITILLLGVSTVITWRR